MSSLYKQLSTDTSQHTDMPGQYAPLDHMPAVDDNTALPSVEETLAQRGKVYGDFKVNSAIAQHLKRSLHSYAGWDRLDSVQAQALDVIMDKVSRILSGDPNYPDNWHDIAGYAKLAEDACHVPF